MVFEHPVQQADRVPVINGFDDSVSEKEIEGGPQTQADECKQGRDEDELVLFFGGKNSHCGCQYYPRLRGAQGMDSPLHLAASWRRFR